MRKINMCDFVKNVIENINADVIKFFILKFLNIQ